MSGQAWFAHESAYIDAGVHIGAGSKIWHFSQYSSCSSRTQSNTLCKNLYIAVPVRS